MSELSSPQIQAFDHADAGRVDAVLKQLRRIVGEKNCTASRHIRYAYSYDLSFVKPKLPDYVVMTESVDQVQQVSSVCKRRENSCCSLYSRDKHWRTYNPRTGRNSPGSEEDE